MMTTKLHRLTLTFRSDGAVDAVCVRKGSERRHYTIHARFDEYGWRQWGESRFILGDNVCLLERILEILVEECLA